MHFTDLSVMAKKFEQYWSLLPKVLGNGFNVEEVVGDPQRLLLGHNVSLNKLFHDGLDVADAWPVRHDQKVDRLLKPETPF